MDLILPWTLHGYFNPGRRLKQPLTVPTRHARLVRILTKSRLLLKLSRKQTVPSRLGTINAKADR